MMAREEARAAELHEWRRRQAKYSRVSFVGGAWMMAATLTLPVIEVLMQLGQAWFGWGCSQVLIANCSADVICRPLNLPSPWSLWIGGPAAVALMLISAWFGGRDVSDEGPGVLKWLLSRLPGLKGGPE